MIEQEITDNIKMDLREVNYDEWKVDGTTPGWCS
jgi:hypothetical protein